MSETSKIAFRQMPTSETWGATGRVVRCVRNASDTGFVAREMRRQETGELRYEPLQVILVDEAGRPKY